MPLTFEMVPRTFLETFIVMRKPEFLYISPSSEGPIDEIRNAIVEEALISRCSHLAMLDTDQQYPVETIPRLLSHKKPVVGTWIMRRYPPFDTLMFRGSVGKYTPLVEEVDFQPGELVEVDATGTGCLLFEMNVFKRLARPWFKKDTHNGRPVGEDFYLCQKLRAAGIPIYVDTALYVPHLTRGGITPNFAKLYRAARKLAVTQGGNGTPHT